MQPNTPDEQPDDEAAHVDPRLKALYQAALLDEDFQQGVSAVMKQLPETEASAAAADSVSAFVHDETLSPALRERLMALMQETPDTASPCDTVKVSWWRQWWRPEGWALLALPAPGFSLALTLVLGMGLGMLLMPLLQQTQLPPEMHLRQAPVVTDSQTLCPETVPNNPEEEWQRIHACEAWLNQRKQVVREDFPNYQPPSP